MSNVMPTELTTRNPADHGLSVAMDVITIFGGLAQVVDELDQAQRAIQASTASTLDELLVASAPHYEAADAILAALNLAALSDFEALVSQREPELHARLSALMGDAPPVASARALLAALDRWHRQLAAREAVTPTTRQTIERRKATAERLRQVLEAVTALVDSF